MAGIVETLRARREAIWEQMKAIAERATEENRKLTPEEQGAWDAQNEELDALDARIKSALDQQKRAKEADAAFDNLAGKAEKGKAGETRESSTSTELRKFLRGEPGSPRYFEVKPEGPVDFRVLSKGVTTAGGFTVPTGFYELLMAHLIESSAILQTNPTVLNTSSGETIQVPKTTAHSTGALVAEGVAIGASDPAFGQVPLGAFKYGVLIQVSRELLDDTGVDLEGYLAMQAGRAIGNIFGAHAITGTGAAQPRGVVTDATLGVTGGTTVGGAFTADNLIDLHYSVIAPYRASRSAFWLLRDSTMAGVRKLKDSTGQYIWQPSLIVGAPDTLLGKPIVTDPNVAAVAVSAKSVLFGDFSQFFVRLAGGVRFERSDDFAFNTDLVTFRALLRADCSLVDLTGAIKFFQGAAT